MTTPQKTRILDALGDASLWLTVASSLPYTIGDAANVLGPTAKKWATIIGLSAAGLLKVTQHAMALLATMPPEADASQVALPPVSLSSSDVKPDTSKQAQKFSAGPLSGPGFTKI